MKRPRKFIRSGSRVAITAAVIVVGPPVSICVLSLLWKRRSLVRTTKSHCWFGFGLLEQLRIWRHAIKHGQTAAMETSKPQRILDILHGAVSLAMQLSRFVGVPSWCVPSKVVKHDSDVIKLVMEHCGDSRHLAFQTISIKGDTASSQSQKR